MITIKDLKIVKLEKSLNIVAGKNAIIASIENNDKNQIAYGIEFYNSLEKEVIDYIENICIYFETLFNYCENDIEDIEDIENKFLPKEELKFDEFKDEYLVYLDDKIYLPVHYKEAHIKTPPYFQGRGINSVKQLEDLCEKFQEYQHQQQIIKQNCMIAVVENKFNKKFPKQN